MEEDKKICPYCGKEIMASAKKCRHCGNWLEENSAYLPKETNKGRNDDAVGHALNNLAHSLGKIIGSVLFVIGLVGAVLYYLYTSEEGTGLQEDVIECVIIVAACVLVSIVGAIVIAVQDIIYTINHSGKV